MPVLAAMNEGGLSLDEVAKRCGHEGDTTWLCRHLGIGTAKVTSHVSVSAATVIAHAVGLDPASIVGTVAIVTKHHDPYRTLAPVVAQVCQCDRPLLAGHDDCVKCGKVIEQQKPREAMRLATLHESEEERRRQFKRHAAA
jgi:hypothetical protein